MKRLSRTGQAERNRALVLAAARRVFLACGYHGATLEQIADEAGFSKGVVYSRFDSKADLFLALLEARIEERAAENAGLAESLPDGDLTVLLDHFARGDHAIPGWQLLVIEFRVHAARDAELSRRYAAAHARTVDALAGVLVTFCARTGQTPAVAPQRLAELALALSVGAALEQAADPDALGGNQLARQLVQALEPLVRPLAPVPLPESAGS
jgi:AcrR family transcriptional regulator